MPFACVASLSSFSFPRLAALPLVLVLLLVDVGIGPAFTSFAATELDEELRLELPLPTSPSPFPRRRAPPPRPAAVTAASDHADKIQELGFLRCSGLNGREWAGAAIQIDLQQNRRI